MKKIIAVLFITALFTAHAYAGGEYTYRPLGVSDTSVEQADIVWEHDMITTPAGIGILSASFVYMNFEIISDRRLSTAILFDSAVAAGAIGLLLMPKENEGREMNMLMLVPISVMGLGLYGCLIYPMYSVVETYVTGNPTNRTRAWGGCIFSALCMAVVMAESPYVREKKDNISVMPSLYGGNMLLTANIKF